MDSSTPPNGGSNPDPRPSSAEESDGAPHLADFVPEAEPDELAGGQVEPGAGAGPGAAVGLTRDGYITADAFFEGFKASQEIAGHFTGLKTLQAAPSRSEAARPASDAIYEIACETPALHWLVKPELKWLQRVGVIAAYAVPVGVGVMGELRERRKVTRPKPGAAPEGTATGQEETPQGEAPPEDMAPLR